MSKQSDLVDLTQIGEGNLSGVNATLTGYLRGPATFVIDPAVHGNDSGTVQIAGNLQVDGTQTIINSTTLTVNDKNIVLASGAGNASAATGAGITVDGASANITYTSATDQWDFNKNIHISSSSNKTLILDSTITGSSLTSLAFQRSGADKWRILQQANDSHLLFYNDISNIDQFSLKSNGNVGIGTISPAATLEVKATNSASTDWSNRGIMSSVQINAANRTFGGLTMVDHGSGSGHAGLGFRYDGSGYKLELGTASSTSSGISTHLTIDRLGAITTSGHLDVGNELTVLGTTILKNSGVVTIKAAPLGNTYGAGFNVMTVTGTSSAPYTSTIGFSNYSETDAMVIKGDKVGIGVALPSAKFNVVGDSGTAVVESIRNPNTGWSQYALTRYGSEGADVRYMDFGYYRGSTEATRGLVVKSQANATLATFLDNGNVGIGFPSPNEKLHVNGYIEAASGYKLASHPVVTYDGFDGGYATQLGSTGTSTLNATRIFAGGSVQATFKGGVLGLGVTPGSWSANYPALQIGGGATFTGHAGNTQTQLGQNWWIGTGNQYVVNGAASRLVMNPDSTIIFSQAPSGTAGAAISSSTDVFVIDTSGRVGIGTGAGVATNAHANADDLVIGNTSTRTGMTIVSDPAQSGAIHFSDGTSTGNANIKGQVSYEHGDNSFRFYINSSTEALRLGTSGGTVFNNGQDINQNFVVKASGNASALVIDGNGGAVGIGCSPAAWWSNSTALQVSPVGALYNTSNYEDFNIANNSYFNSTGTERYIQNDAACKIRLTDAGLMDFRVAGAGTAGNAITWDTAMSITALGRVGVGVTQTDPVKFEVSSGTDEDKVMRIRLIDDNNSNATANPFSYEYKNLEIENTYSGAAPSANGTKVAKLQFTTVTASGYAASASIMGLAESNGHEAGAMVFATGPNSSGNEVERMRISRTGEVTVEGPFNNKSNYMMVDSNWGQWSGKYQHLVCHNTITQSQAWTDVAYVSYSPSLTIQGNAQRGNDGGFGQSNYFGTVMGGYGNVSAAAERTMNGAMNGAGFGTLEYRYLNSGAPSGSYRLQVRLPISSGTIYVTTTLTGQAWAQISED